MKTRHHSHPYRKMFTRDGLRLKRRPNWVIRIIPSKIDEETLKEFKKQWEAALSGIGNAHRIPFISDQT